MEYLEAQRDSSKDELQCPSFFVEKRLITHYFSTQKNSETLKNKVCAKKLQKTIIVRGYRIHVY